MGKGIKPSSNMITERTRDLSTWW